MLLRRDEERGNIRIWLYLIAQTWLRNCKNKPLSSPGDIWKEGSGGRDQAKVYCGLQKQELLLDN